MFIIPLVSKYSNMQLKFNCIYLSFLLLGCTQNQEENQPTKQREHKNTLPVDTLSKVDTIAEVEIVDTLEQRIIDLGLVNIQSVDSSIQVDLKYASTDNFMHLNMYGNLHRAYLQPDIAKRLSEAQMYLKTIDSNLTLLVYDAVRPRYVQQIMWDSIDKPFAEKIKFVSNPRNGSIHNYGAAIDLTIMDLLTNRPLDMGAGYDDPRKIAYPRYESHFLEKGDLTPEQVENRKLLRKVMGKGDFSVISTEWWHFNGCSRATAKAKYPVLN